MRILNIQPQAALADRLEAVAARARWSATSAESGAEGLQLARLDDYDILLADAELPDMSSLDLIRGVRAAGLATPILVLRGERDPHWIARALTTGADDVVLRNIDPAELVARIAAIARRARGHGSPVIALGPLVVDIHRKTVEAHGRPLRLTGMEYAIFELLAVRAGAVVTRATIRDHLYGGLDEPEVDVLPTYLCRLRRKLSEAGVDERVLQTVWGRGLRLTATPPADAELKAAA